MHKSPRPRRRRRYGAQLCALIAAVLLLLSVSVLYSRLGFDRDHHLHHHNDAAFDSDSLLDDGDLLGDRISSAGSDDRIDEHDVVQDDSEPNEEDILRTGEEDSDQPGVSGYYFDHIKGVVRRAFDKRSIDEWEDYLSFDPNLVVNSEDQSKAAFASDDIPMDENVRTKMDGIKNIEDLLLLVKKSPLREGWGEWFDKKGDFLRRDRMFKSHLELLNPMNNPLLQDPDGTGVTGLTRGDKIVLKGLLNELKKVRFLVKKPLAAVDSLRESKLESEFKSDLIEDGIESVDDKFGGNESREMSRGKRRTLDSNNGSDGSYRSNIVDKIRSLNVSVLSNSSAKSDKNEGFEERNRGNIVEVVDFSNGNLAQLARSKNVEVNGGTKPVYADGKRWGYFPGIDPRLSFSNFMDAYFRKGKCFMRVFMVWNSPPWMFSIRQQRGLESLLLQHRDACVVVFSETIELNFFDSLVKDGFKVAVVMPNLDELLKDTPTHIFASVWLEWKKTKFYSTHYSELVRLAALYKYGGIYLDSDIVVLKPLSSLTNTVGLENEHAGSPLNGAVMAFNKHSSFILACLTEFYSSYDDTRLRWNGADLLTRVAKHFLNTESSSNEQIKLKLQPSFAFFPIGKREITSYFTAPSTDIEQAEQDVLLRKILNDSLTFHFWNSLTSALIPEPESLVARLMNHQCIHCSDVL